MTGAEVDVRIQDLETMLRNMVEANKKHASDTMERLKSIQVLFKEIDEDKKKDFSMASGTIWLLDLKSAKGDPALGYYLNMPNLQFTKVVAEIK